MPPPWVFSAAARLFGSFLQTRLLRRRQWQMRQRRAAETAAVREHVHIGKTGLLAAARYYILRGQGSSLPACDRCYGS